MIMKLFYIFRKENIIQNFSNLRKEIKAFPTLKVKEKGIWYLSYFKEKEDYDILHVLKESRG